MDLVKCWFHRRRRTSDAFASVILLAGLLLATANAQTAALEPADAAVDSASEQAAALLDFLERVTSFRSKFHQELWSDDERLMEVAEGTVELQRPGKFRWHYDEPYEQLIVADGESLWMYDVEISQVTRSELPANDTANPGALLSGDSDVMQSFEILGSEDDGDTVSVDLAPRAADSDYSSVRVSFRREDAAVVLSELAFVDGLSQTTVIEFRDAEVNPELEPDRFLFVVPSGAHVLGGPD